MYDPYRPPAEPEPDDPAPRWETFEPDESHRRSSPRNRQPRPSSGARNRGAANVGGAAHGSRPASMSSAMVGIVGILVVAGIGIGISQSAEDADPSVPPDGWAQCVADQEAEIRARGGSLLEPEDFCAIRFPDYEWENDPSSVEE